MNIVFSGCLTVGAGGWRALLGAGEGLLVFADGERRGLGARGRHTGGEPLPRLLPVAGAWSSHCPQTAGVFLLLLVKDRGRILLGELQERMVLWVQGGPWGKGWFL